MSTEQDQPRPLWLRLLNAQARLRGRAGLLPPFDTERLLRRGLRRAGVPAFRDESFLEGLGVLVGSVNGEANLDGFGRLMFGELVARLLEQRGRLETWLDDHPPAEDVPARGPLIILGLPRTGTTHLHRLLSCDPRFRTVRTVEIERPVPPPGPEAGMEDRRARRVQWEIDLFERLAPALQGIHPRRATWPEECQNILAYQFHSLIFAHALDVPSYREWMTRRDTRPDLAFHRRFLQHLQAGQPERIWLLKSPQHILHLEELVETYPGAMIVQTHREPMEAVTSVASLTWNTQRVFSETVTREAAGIGQRRLFAGCLERCLAARERLGGGRILDISYPRFVADEMGTVEGIYESFGLTMSEDARRAMEAFRSARTRERRGLPPHRYSSADFGLTRDEEEPVWQKYRDRYLDPVSWDGSAEQAGGAGGSGVRPGLSARSSRRPPGSRSRRR